MKELLTYPTFKNLFNELRKAKNPSYKVTHKWRLRCIILVLSEAGVISVQAAKEAMQELSKI